MHDSWIAKINDEDEYWFQASQEYKCWLTCETCEITWINGQTYETRECPLCKTSKNVTVYKYVDGNKSN